MHAAQVASQPHQSLPLQTFGSVSQEEYKKNGLCIGIINLGSAFGEINPGSGVFPNTYTAVKTAVRVKDALGKHWHLVSGDLVALPEATKCLRSQVKAPLGVASGVFEFKAFFVDLNTRFQPTPSYKLGFFKLEKFGRKWEEKTIMPLGKNGKQVSMGEEPTLYLFDPEDIMNTQEDLYVMRLDTIKRMCIAHAQNAHPSTPPSAPPSPPLPQPRGTVHQGGWSTKGYSTQRGGGRLGVDHPPRVWARPP